MGSFFINKFIIDEIISEEWKGRKQIPTFGGTQEMICVSEQGLYCFLGRLDKPKAITYQKCIAGDVMLSISKIGEYIIIKAEYPKNFSRTDRISAANIILSKHFEDNKLVFALDKVHARVTDESVLKITNTQLIAPQQKTT